ncbi:hypothetical protein OCU04_005286 [Sclerotinia nivalis]|uniref:Uncharacterized protein n=1 Tax=Sclerotinia nivalis TaxID=352851 RepID=A0A9X0ANW4_9HELO|nr:hypothetical protein OCU04_005286 [Sclerotinia nivalis]
MRDNFGSDGSKMTQSVNSITAGKMKHDWKGPLFVVAFEGVSVPQSLVLKVGDMSFSAPGGVAFQRGIDVTLKDLRIVHDYFLAYPYGAAPGLTLKDQHGNSII